jgi:hypothetical protein
MSWTNYFFGSKETNTIETNTIGPIETNTIFLLYGSKVSCSNEQSYVVGVFNNQELAIKELNAINEKNQLTNVGRSIIDPKTGIKEFHYRYFLIDCKINKNYEDSIEDFTYGKLPSNLRR